MKSAILQGRIVSHFKVREKYSFFSLAASLGLTFVFSNMRVLNPLPSKPLYASTLFDTL